MCAGTGERVHIIIFTCARNARKKTKARKEKKSENYKKKRNKKKEKRKRKDKKQEDARKRKEKVRTSSIMNRRQIIIYPSDKPSIRKLTSPTHFFKPRSKPPFSNKRRAPL